MKNKIIKSGKCKLTHSEGKFIKSHLIPQSLTKPEIKGKPMKQIGEGLPEKRFNSSWYDQEIVTIEGENILTEFDTAAVIELRKHKLLWSSFTGQNIFEIEDFQSIEDGYGVRSIKGVNHKILRLFVLSLLWRACTSNRIEFKEIKIPKQDLEKIRLMLLNRDENPIHFYPVKFCQISTKGKIHNHSPIITKFELPFKCELTKSKFIKIIRFYFDGLMIHINLTKTLQQTKGFDKQLLGFDSDNLIVTTVPYEKSKQREIFESIAESYDSNFELPYRFLSKHQLSMSTVLPSKLYLTSKK